MPYDEWGEWYDDGTETPSTPEPEQPTTDEPEPEQPATPELQYGWDLTKAIEYIELNAIDNEDFLDADAKTQARLLNVARRTLVRKYASLIIPTNAEYLYAAALAVAFNDTNKLQQQGVASFSVKGLSFSFKDWAKKGLDALIPQEVLDLISDENGVSLKAGRSIKAVTL